MRTSTQGGDLTVLPGNPSTATLHQQVVDALVRDMVNIVESPVGLIVGPWPLAADEEGIGDAIHRALLADDWAESGMRAKHLQRLIDVQLVARNRQYGADHAGGADLGITLHGEVVGRLLLDLDDAAPGVEFDGAAVTLVDISVHPQWQRQGIGGEVLRVLLTAAADANRPVRLSAVFGTVALNWFLAVGFRESGGDVLYHQLEWRP